MRQDIDVLVSEVGPRESYSYVSEAGVTTGFVPAACARSAA